MLQSIVEYCAEHEGSRCGYCKRPDSAFSHGMWAHTMTVSDYQDLIDRGWRRSGKYCYKPTMDVTCCPMYTIRCRMQELRPTKSQKKVLKRFNKFLEGQEPGSNTGSTGRKMSLDGLKGEEGESGGDMFVEPSRAYSDVDISAVQPIRQSDSSLIGGAGAKLNAPDQPKREESMQNHCKKGDGPDASRGPCKKAKQLRLERKMEKLREKGVELPCAKRNEKNKEKGLDDFLNELSVDAKKRLEIKLVRTNPRSAEYLATAKDTHQVYAKYQIVIHGDKPEKVTKAKFEDFLVESPLREEYQADGPPCGYGSFHQQYWLDGKLAAVGVIDVLPLCVSSVYFFYDPQYTSLTFGTYGALRELYFTKQLNTVSPALKYYYMGYYIHSCKKMRYKGQFYPSDLLCPETYKWFEIQNCIPRLVASAYSRLDPDIDSIDVNDVRDRDLDNIPILTGSTCVYYKNYKKRDVNVNRLRTYAKLVGAKTAKSLILVQ